MPRAGKRRKGKKGRRSLPLPEASSPRAMCSVTCLAPSAAFPLAKEPLSQEVWETPGSQGCEHRWFESLVFWGPSLRCSSEKLGHQMWGFPLSSPGEQLQVLSALLTVGHRVGWVRGETASQPLLSASRRASPPSPDAQGWLRQLLGFVQEKLFHMQLQTRRVCQRRCAQDAPVTT